MKGSAPARDGSQAGHPIERRVQSSMVIIRAHELEEQPGQVVRIGIAADDEEIRDADVVVFREREIKLLLANPPSRMGLLMIYDAKRYFGGELVETSDDAPGRTIHIP